MPRAVSPTPATSVENSVAQNAQVRPSAFQRVARVLGGLLCRSSANVQVVLSSPDSYRIPTTSKLLLLSNMLLEKYGPSIKVQNVLSQQFIERSQALGYTDEQPLFAFANGKAGGPGYAAQPGDTLIVKPLNDAKLILADLYNKKYGIQVFIETDQLSPEQIAQKIELDCDRNEGKPIGIIFQTTDPGSAYLGDEDSEGDYQGHVTPVIIQKTEKGIDVVALDSVLNFNARLLFAVLELEKNNSRVRMINLHEGRQADPHSCHTDAIQILKDSLLQHGNSVESIVDELTTQYNAKREIPLKSRFDVEIDLPPYLQKTTQRSGAMISNNYNHAQLMQTQLPPTEPGKYQTVQQHREKYTRTQNAESSKLRNHFLVVKAFHNANKVLDHLESFDSDSTRQEYLAGLHKQYSLNG